MTVPRSIEPDTKPESRAPTSEPRCPHCNRLASNLDVAEVLALCGHVGISCSECGRTDFLRTFPGTDVPVLPPNAATDVVDVAIGKPIV